MVTIFITSCITQAAIIKYHRWRAHTSEIYLSQFWRLESPSSRCWQGRFRSVRASPCPYVVPILPPVHMTSSLWTPGRRKKFSAVYSYKGTNSIRPSPYHMASFNIYFHKEPSPNIGTLEVRASTYKFWGGHQHSSCNSITIVAVIFLRSNVTITLYFKPSLTFSKCFPLCIYVFMYRDVFHLKKGLSYWHHI